LENFYLILKAKTKFIIEYIKFIEIVLTGMCTKHEICGAIKVVLCTALADSCIKSGHRATAIFAVSGPDNFRQSKSVRAGLQFSVGKFHRWMCDVKMGNFVDEVAAIYLTSAIENLLEEIILQCLSIQINEFVLTANLLDTCIANNSDFWGLLQPFAHLNAGRTANGMLSLPTFHNYNTLNESNSDNKNNTQLTPSKTIEQQLLTTCVGSVQELGIFMSFFFC
jgi:ankyrin repeat/BTB/POZ domain-containing protein 2